MKTSIATVSIAGSLREKLVAIARAGFDGYEIFEPDLIASSMSPEEVRQLSADLGLTIDLYQPFRDIEGVSGEQFGRNLRRAEAKFELMGRLGVDLMLVCSNVGTATIDDDGLAAEQLRAMAELAESYNVRLAYEALAWGRYVSTYDHAWDIVNSADHPALGVCLDSFHILSRSSSLEGLAAIPGDKIFYCQLADAPSMSLDVLSWSRHHRLFPGEGEWDITNFMVRVLRAGYAGPLSLEIFNDVFRQGVPSVTARDAHRSLVALEDAVRLQQLVEGEAAVENLHGLEEVQTPRGVAFVEVQPGEGDDLHRLLIALGFDHRGRHRRKAAELYELGSARIVVNNALSDSTAEIVALGLDVDDMALAAARARALDTTLIPRDSSDDEQAFAAVLAPNGVEFYFCEDSGGSDSWRREFGPPNSSSTTSSFLGIDHVALRQPWRRVDEATLFFRAVIGLAVDEGQDLASQVGLVRSKSLTTTDRTVRLALNVTPVGHNSEDTFSDHVALSSDDIFETAAECRARGLRALDVPSNYYADLAGRYGLAPELVARLSEYSILFERDDLGDFFHFYTQHVGSLSFEVVQRIGKYDAYGATNAFVRLASQRATDVRRPVT
jgi:4-hydroxyphenylpyruvate dioxygenase